MPCPKDALPRSALLAAGALVLALSLAGCQTLTELDDKEEDSATRVEYYEQAAKTYYDGGRYENAARMWEKVLVERPDDQWAKFGLAKSLQMMGTPPTLRQAEKILLEVRQLCWDHPTRGNVKFEVDSSLATVYSSLADFYDRDARILKGQLANDPNADAALLQSQIQKQTSMRDELLRQSIPIWTEVLAASPDNQYALAGLAKAQLTAGGEDIGIDYARRYIALSRKSEVGWRQKLADWEKTAGTQVTTDQRGFFMEKIQGCRTKELGMHLLLGAVFMRREQFADAVTEYDEVVAIDPATPAAYVERAQAYAAMQIYPAAVKDLEHYLKVTDPERQRAERVNAADLLERYRRLSGQAPDPGARRAAPAPAPRAAPPVAPPRPATVPPPAPPPLSPAATGSPDN